MIASEAAFLRVPKAPSPGEPPDTRPRRDRDGADFVALLGGEVDGDRATNPETAPPIAADAAAPGSPEPAALIAVAQLPTAAPPPASAPPVIDGTPAAAPVDAAAPAEAPGVPELPSPTASATTGAATGATAGAITGAVATTAAAPGPVAPPAVVAAPESGAADPAPDRGPEAIGREPAQADTPRPVTRPVTPPVNSQPAAAAAEDARAADAPPQAAAAEAPQLPDAIPPKAARPATDAAPQPAARPEAPALAPADAATPAWTLVREPVPATMPRHDAPTAPAPQPQAIVGQIAVAVAGADQRTVEIRLDPPELGRVQIHLTPTDGGVQAMVLADRPETGDLLRRHAAQLARELGEAGYGEVSLEFAAGGQPARDDPPQPPRPAWTAPLAAVEPAAAAATPAARGAGPLDVRL